MEKIPDIVRPLMSDVVHQLVIGNYMGLIADGRAAGWSVEILRDIITEIEHDEGRLVELPDIALDDESRGAVPKNDGSGWRVDVRIWTVNGPSEYTLSTEVYRTSQGLKLHIEDLRVM